MMTIGKSDNNLRQADFQCCEDVKVESFIGRFKVQGMHNGDVYMQELPKQQSLSIRQILVFILIKLILMQV